MEEVWLEQFDSTENSIHFEDFPETPSEWRDEELHNKWLTIRRVRKVVTGALEVKRQDKTIGASLEAAPIVFVKEKDKEILDSVDFQDICITSGIELSLSEIPKNAYVLDDVSEVGVVFELARGNKCQRCWKVLPEVGYQARLDVCQRCNEAL